MRKFSLILGCAFFLGAPASAVTIDWVTVGDPGNACDPQPPMGCFGGVAYSFQISKYEVTNEQYAEYLNAVADADSNGLYSSLMATFGAITQSGISGSFTYTVKTGFADKPVDFVSFWDSLRFANWLHNGQPTGAQGSATTEDGAYTITTSGIAGNSITRNAGATIFLTSEDEWYKAAYYDAVATRYFDFPAGADTETGCTAPGATANTANCASVVGNVTDVGSYTGSPSPYGTFDQGGNVVEWTEAFTSRDVRRVMGGSFADTAYVLATGFRTAFGPTTRGRGLGFRVASVPEPGAGLLVLTGMLGLSIWRRRRT